MSAIKSSSIKGVFILTLLSAITSCGLAAPTVLNSIRAVVNGEPITQSMVDSAVRTQVQVWLMGNKGIVSRSQAEREIREMESKALNDLIDRKLILSEFKKMGGNIKDQYVDDAVNRFVKDRFDGDRDKFVAELKKTGMTISQFRDVQRDQIAIQALRTEHAGDEVIPNTPWEKKRVYNEIKSDYASEGKPKTYVMSIPKQTPTSTPEEQEKVLANVRSQLKSGASFTSLAKKYSDDSFASNGGYVGVLERSGKLAQGLHDLAYSLPPGQVTPTMDHGTHWRIVYVSERVGKTTPSFDKIEDEVDKRLTVEKRQKNLETWLAKLRRDANVRIYED